MDGKNFFFPSIDLKRGRSQRPAIGPKDFRERSTGPSISASVMGEAAHVDLGW